MIAAFVVVLMLVANGTVCFQGALQISRHRRCRIACGAGHHFYAALLKNIHSAAAHTTGQNHFGAVIGQIVGQKARLMPWIGHRLLGFDGAILRVKKYKALTMAKMLGHLPIVTGNCNSFHGIDTPFCVLMLSA